MRSKSILSTVLLLQLCSVAAWTSRMPTPVRTPTFLNSSTGASNNDIDNPCWQDIWSYDCAMSTVYSAAFVAGDWVKSMPCASGLIDCETPEELNMPGPAGTGVEDVDVMSFLNLKRAKPLKAESE